MRDAWNLGRRRIAGHLIRKTIENDEDGACRQRVDLVETRGMVRRMRSNTYTHVHVHANTRRLSRAESDADC